MLLNNLPTADGCSIISMVHDYPPSLATHFLSLVRNCVCKFLTPNTLVMVYIAQLILAAQLRSLSWQVVICTSRTAVRRFYILHSRSLAVKKIAQEAFLAGFGVCGVGRHDVVDDIDVRKGGDLA
jgi:hypothetical protein